jgi:hypothetical protein
MYILLLSHWNIVNKTIVNLLVVYNPHKFNFSKFGKKIFIKNFCYIFFYCIIIIMKSTVLKTRTRQIGNGKGRTTLNSKSEKCETSKDILYCQSHIKKKIKLDETVKNKNEINSEKIGNVLVSNELYSDIESDEDQDNIQTDGSVDTDKSSKLVFNDNTNAKLSFNYENVLTENKNDFHPYKKYTHDVTTKDIIGEGYISLLHAYCRDTLFKKIKILSDEHLEGNGFIIQSCLQKINYSSSMGNRQAFINACRTEIRKTVNSRRNYVKREIGKLMISKYITIVFIDYV